MGKFTFKLRFPPLDKQCQHSVLRQPLCSLSLPIPAWGAAELSLLRGGEHRAVESTPQA